MTVSWKYIGVREYLPDNNEDTFIMNSFTQSASELIVIDLAMSITDVVLVSSVCCCNSKCRQTNVCGHTWQKKCLSIYNSRRIESAIFQSLRNVFVHR